MSKYLKQLGADLPRWVGLGYVSEPNAALILRDAEANQKDSWFRLPLILSMLGSLLVFAGVISFVAANWDDISRLARVVLLVGAMLGSLGAAHYCRLKGSEGLAQGFAFFAALLFGADIMLIAQIYQLPANPPGGALLWALAATAVAVLWPSQMSMGLAFALAAIWSWFAASSRTGLPWDLLFALPHQVHWQFLLFWSVLAAYSVKRGWTKALHLAGLSLMFWSAHTLFALFDDQSARIAGVALMALVAFVTAGGQIVRVAQPGAGIVSRYIWSLFAFWLLMVSAPDIFRDVARHGPEVGAVFFYLPLIVGVAAAVYALPRYERLPYVLPVAAGTVVAAAIGLLSGVTGLAGHSYYDMYYMSSPAGLQLFMGMVLASILTMAAAVGSIVHGYRSGERFFINLGFSLFAAKLIWLYFDNEWGLANRAGFFIVGGLLIVAIGVLFDRQRRKLIQKMQEGK